MRDEAELLCLSLSRREPRRQGLGIDANPGERIAYPDGRIVRLEETAGPRWLLDGDQRAALIFPADVYGSLPLERRRDIMQGVRGRRVVVYGVPLASAGGIVRLSAMLRGSLASVGIRAGEPGDAAVRTEQGLRIAHAFTASELERELERFCLGPVRVETVATEAGLRLRAAAGPPFNKSAL